MSDSRKPSHYVQNMTLAAAAGQSGCTTTMIVIGAMLLGLWIDARLDTKPLFTLGLILGSIPLSLYLMVRMVLELVSRITPPNEHEATQIQYQVDESDE